jgi:hypothetical protein
MHFIWDESGLFYYTELKGYEFTIRQEHPEDGWLMIVFETPDEGEIFFEENLQGIEYNFVKYLDDVQSIIYHLTEELITI